MILNLIRFRAMLAASLATRSMRVAAQLVMLLMMVAICGCHHDMQDQPRYDPLEHNPMFPNGLASRPLVPGTVARGHLRVDTVMYEGRRDGQLVDRVPMPVTEELLHRGQERFNIFCSPCHSRVGDGNGMIVLRGYRRPPTFHSPRLRGMPDGYFFDIMTRGFGQMPQYATQVPVEDRWAITAYIRALQLSQYASLDQVPEADRAKITSEAAP